MHNPTKSEYGEGTTLVPPFATDYAFNISIGKRVFINSNCSFLDGAGIAIKDDHDAWIGCGCGVTPGVTIGARSVIGAGAVVTRDIPDDGVAVGNPVKVIRIIDNRDVLDKPTL
ncbi:putative maltose O-acetyltransferase [Monocercomonoides exilis]|uniref:putative maltose O-acetyltransferase n=1 Tax=Monocercomonoides exilis TaxID=2049356 RepID=UPI00355A1DAD|nr:putative maltose O-acetyltransferase [Monocercomonoides exilis]|eukprot:MONOS_1654.1-p1 / transcript=MONOS_1654.1 / gene=MONOS_1654 / organism=Monocercomonoides_exilis_PA203 / gene_product=putative maltose O-acetyltransferase / transcript_product=putative maltose O-acetyltransferase / location=Mono_scaffold00030:129102-129696(-) / protein_length=113 / sequence_SO=supercontig / SO=protein_coding / is_pseudo=false